MIFNTLNNFFAINQLQQSLSPNSYLIVNPQYLHNLFKLNVCSKNVLEMPTKAVLIK